jgi:phosphatidylglycerophosphate synthase
MGRDSSPAAAVVSPAREPASPMLWVASSPPGVSPTVAVVGLPLARRIALAARRAGFGRLVFEAPREGGEDAAQSLEGALADTGAEIVAAGSPAPDARFGAIVLEGGVLPQVSWLRARAKGVAPSPASAFEIATHRDVSRAERWLLAGLVKDEESFMSRHFERKISLAISRRLSGTGVTPNAMTLVSVAVGLAGAACFVGGTAAWSVAGALLFLVHSILDGCDGELARLNFQESRFGGVLDFWGDNVVHCAVFAGIAAGRFLATGERWPLAAGAAAIAGTLACAAFVFARTMSRPKEGPQFTTVAAGAPSRVSKAADALARRDFIYLVILLSAFGRAHWFLALAAVGAPAFFLALVALDLAGRRGRRRERLGRSVP